MKTFNDKIHVETKELKQNEKGMTHIKNKRPRVRSTKRCHFCRKRGHIQRKCLIKKFLLNWLWGDVGVSKQVKDHPVDMQSVKVTHRERQKNTLP